MKRIIMVAQLLVLLASAPACVQRPIAADLRDELDAGLSPSRCEQILDELLPGMGAEKLVDREQPQQRFEALCFAAGQPGRESGRAMLCEAMLTRLGPGTARPARVWLLRQLERIAGEECVPRLAELLDDEDPRIRELTRKALQNTPSVQAAGALFDAMEQPGSTGWQIALINAVGAHACTPEHIRAAELDGRRSAYHTLSVLVRNADEAVAAAAIAALSDVGRFDWSHWEAVHETGRPALEERADAALLRSAERLVAAGDKQAAHKAYDKLYRAGSTPAIRIAGLYGIVVTRGEESVPLLLWLIAGDDPHLAATAAQFAAEIPGPAATHVLIETFRDAPPAAQVLLLDTFAARGDPAARPTIVAAVQSEDELVRMAALRALQHLGDGSTAVLLAQAAARSNNDERAAARNSLNRLRGADVDQAILAALREQTDAAVRCELIKSLAARLCREAKPSLLDATTDPVEPLRVAAFEALGVLAAADDLPTLVDHLVEVEGDEAREAAENAVVETTARVADAAQRAEPVLAVLGDRTGAVKASLIRVLGRIGGERALQAIRTARTDTDRLVADAAIRTLAKWPDPEVLGDLLEVMRSTGDQAHRVLALRGYVRLVRVPSDRTQMETLDLLVKALALAASPEEQKLVLAGLADVKHVLVLRMVELMLEDEAVCDEAAVTLLKIARGLVAEERGAALEAIDKVRLANISQAVQQQLEETTQFIERFEGYSAAWLVAGPYMQEGKKSGDLFGLAFPPETPGATDVAWTALHVHNDDNPWIFNLAKAIGGESRCAYVKTLVWSKIEQAAQLEIGSDDAVKAWLNDELVHSNLVYRGVAPAQDKVNVTLKAGWNALMLKVVQGSGDWAFCAGFRSPEGGKLSGLGFKRQ